MHVQLVLFANGTAKHRQPRFRGPVFLPDRHEQAAGVDGYAQRLRQGGADPRERVAGSLGQLCIGLGLHPTRTQHQRLQFVRIEHQRRQQEARPHPVAHAGIAVDDGTLRAQAGDVAVQRAQADRCLLYTSDAADE